MRYFIITQVKNQEDRIYEWLLYHYREGFTSFIIFDDMSEDNTIGEVKRFKSNFEAEVIIEKTDGIGGTYDIDSCKNSDSYGQDISFHQRLNRSYSRGNKIAKSLDKDAICAIIDVDEFLFTRENKKIVDILEDIFSNVSINQVRVINFDILDNYDISKKFISNENNIFYVWSESDLDVHPVWRSRAKCIVRSISVENITFVHDVLNGQFPSDVNQSSYDERNYSKLKLLHFRKPNLSAYESSKIKFYNDDFINKKIKLLCEDTNS